MNLPLSTIALWATIASFITLISALDNGLARSPPMGWLAWQRFTCQTDCVNYPNDCINESLFKQQAEKLTQGGYRARGYEYVNIDDCWSAMQRDSSSGRLVANHSRFPTGLQELSAYMHARKIKLGIYGDCGMKTCAGYPAQLHENDKQSTGARNYFQVDAETLHGWQIDSFKFDGCHVDPIKAERICPKFSETLSAASHNHSILLVCEWPFYMMYAHTEPDWQVAADSCNVWRYYDDIEDSWASILNTIDYTVKHQSTIVKYHGPGHWFDPDMLVIGNFGLSIGQARAQMAIWSVWAAPLYMSNDLRSIKVEFAQILKNKYLIEVNQDKLGVFGLMVAQSSDQSMQVFVKPILPIIRACPSFALVYLNRATLGNKQKVAFKLRDLLNGAPIRMAAKNQRQVWDYERQHAPSEQTAQQQHEPIKASECFKRLKKSTSSSQTKPGKGPEATLNWLKLIENQDNQEELNGNGDKAILYEMFDLFNDASSLGQIGIDSDLVLEVEPQSVRAIKLLEL